MAVETITNAQFHEQAKHWEHTALTTEVLLALAVVVLSILGIVGVFPTYLAAIAVIGLGAVLFFQSANLVLRYRELLYDASATSTPNASYVSRGITADLLAGMAGIVLGVLALLGIAPMTLLSVTVIIYGATLLVTSGELASLNSLDASESAMIHQWRHSMGLDAAGAQVLIGLAGLVLGILALVGIASMTMVLVALLATSVSTLLRSSFVGGLLQDFLHM